MGFIKSSLKKFWKTIVALCGIFIAIYAGLVISKRNRIKKKTKKKLDELAKIKANHTDKIKVIDDKIKKVNTRKKNHKDEIKKLTNEQRPVKSIITQLNKEIKTVKTEEVDNDKMIKELQERFSD